MKKLFVTLSTILLCGAIYALPVGNPSEASALCDGLVLKGSCCLDPCNPCATWCDALTLRFGYYGDFVFNHHFKVDAHPRNTVDHSTIATNAGYIALNVCDRIDVFTTLGASRFFLESNAITFNTDEIFRGDRFELKTNSKFSWSVGARGTLWECGCTAVGLEGQYFRASPNIERITVGALESVYPNDDQHIKYQEWQIGFGISHRINMLTPYAAIKWSKSRLGIKNTFFPETSTLLPDLKTRNGWGYAIGVSIIDCEKMSVTAEGRWGNEKALYVNGQIRF